MKLKEGRVRTVVKMVAEGKKNKEIASKLCVAEITVRKILERLMREEGLKNRVQVAIEYYKTYGDV